MFSYRRSQLGSVRRLNLQAAMRRLEMARRAEADWRQSARTMEVSKTQSHLKSLQLSSKLFIKKK